MNIDGWEINIEKLVGPHNGNWNYTFDHFLYQSNTQGLACLIYDVSEIAMGWEVGLLAIYKNKTKPELIINPNNLLCIYSNHTVQFSQQGTIVFIKKHATDGNKNRFELPFCIIDLGKNKFTYYRMINSLPYKVMEESSNCNRYRLIENYRDNRFESYHDHIIDLNNREWYKLKDLERFDEIYFSEV